MLAKKHILKCTGFVIFAAMLLISCQPQKGNNTATTPVESVLKEEKPKASWEEEWNKAVSDAKREGTVVIFTTFTSEGRRTLADAFKARYGIRVEFVTGSGVEIISKLKKERSAGIFSTDLWTGGVNSLFLYLRPEGGLDPIRPLLIFPEILNPKIWWQGELPFVDKKGTDVMYYQAGPDNPIAINTTLVKTGEIQSYYDLLQPRWSGKIILKDPTFPGSGLQWFGVISFEILNLDFFKQLVEQKPVLLRDSRLIADWLAKGKYPMALAGGGDIYNDHIEAGSPIVQLTPKEGTYVSAGKGHVALLNRAPHPKAAKVFINWLLTKEGLTLISKIESRQSARLDIPTNHLSESLIRKPGLKYYTTMTEDNTVKADEHLVKAKEVFSPLLK